MQAAQAIDPAQLVRPTGPPTPPWWLRGLRGEGRIASVVALGTLVYGVGAGTLYILGWVLGDATGWLYVANLSTIYWLAPAVGLCAFAIAVRWWLPALACALAAVVWLATFAPLFVPQTPSPSADLRIATFNVRPESGLDHVIRLAQREQPDVLLVQELLLESQDELAVELASVLPHHHFSRVNQRTGDHGTAVFSRFPVARTREIGPLPAVSRPVDVVTLDTGDGPLHVVSLHLTSPCDECLSSDLGDVRRNAASLAPLGRESDLRRSEMARVIAALPAGSLIVGGDLNSSTHNTPRRRLLAAGLTDLHRESGSGPGFTAFRGQFGFRIDWLYATDDLTPVRTWVGPPDLSDHRPVIADLALPDGP